MLEFVCCRTNRAVLNSTDRQNNRGDNRCSTDAKWHKNQLIMKVHKYLLLRLMNFWAVEELSSFFTLAAKTFKRISTHCRKQSFMNETSYFFSDFLFSVFHCRSLQTQSVSIGSSEAAVPETSKLCRLVWLLFEIRETCMRCFMSS